MKTILFALAVAGSSFVATTSAAPAATTAWNCPMQRGWCGGTDGVWWQHLPAQAKVPVIEGMIASYELAYNLGTFYTVSDWVTAYENDTDQAAAQTFHRLIGGNGVTFSKPVAVYVAAIDRFYKTYPAKRALKVAGLLRCLEDHPEASCEQVGTSTLLPWPTGV